MNYVLQQGGLGYGGKALRNIKVVKWGLPIIRTYGITVKGKKYLYGGE